MESCRNTCRRPKTRSEPRNRKESRHVPKTFCSVSCSRRVEPDGPAVRCRRQAQLPPEGAGPEHHRAVQRRRRGRHRCAHHRPPAGKENGDPRPGGEQARRRHPGRDDRTHLGQARRVHHPARAFPGHRHHLSRRHPADRLQPEELCGNCLHRPRSLSRSSSPRTARTRA